MNIKIKSSNLELRDINTIIFDKDGTLTNSHIYWGEIIKLRSIEIIKRFNLEDKYLNLIAKSMGFEFSKKKLLMSGPIALESRKKVIEILYNKIGFLDDRLNEDS